MSRVIKPGNKYMNTTKYDSSVTGPSKMVRIHCDGEDYHKARTIAQWLFVKYDMSYKAYRNKSKNRRDELRAEFESDTGVDLKERERQRLLAWDPDFTKLTAKELQELEISISEMENGEFVSEDDFWQ